METNQGKCRRHQRLGETGHAIRLGGGYRRSRLGKSRLEDNQNATAGDLELFEGGHSINAGRFQKAMEWFLEDQKPRP